MMDMRGKTVGLIIITGLWITTACDPHRVYEKNTRLPSAEWSKEQPVIFNVPIEDTASAHHVFINIRNSGKYENRNLFLFITTTAPSGHFVKDTLECLLADENGKWYGSGLGDLYFVQAPYKMGVKFPYPGMYRFEIKQAMRRDILKHITDIGLRIEKVEP